MPAEKAKKKNAKPAKADKPADKAEAAKTEATDKKPASKPAKKGKRRHVPLGNAHIQASYNNTIVTLTEPNGNVIAWSSCGSSGFKGTRKSTPYAAQVTAEKAAEKGKVFGLEKVKIFICGVGNGREQAIRGLTSGGLDIISITDVTPIPHNGCRQRKARRI
ncbi:MAG: 30S ribosomal protein S11 [Candidatus Gracilibacteria bacterium]